MRILFCVHTPWTEKLGVPKVSIELSRHLQALGHRCEKYSLEDAGIVPTRLSDPFTVARFQRSLLNHIREQGHKYDVIQAEHNLLPFRRQGYRFNGSLIAKSNGLEYFYSTYQKDVEPWLKQAIGMNGTFAGNTLRKLGRLAARSSTATAASLSNADLIHVLNRDELRYVSNNMDLGDKCVVVPNGLSDSQAEALAASSTATRRSRSNTVVFIGTWSFRKGRIEFPKIVRQVRQANPEAQFHLVGTYANQESVLSEFAPTDRNSVKVTPQFDPGELPKLLADAKCGVFPSYIEGFGIGLLEMLAGGIPVVAWDVPGPREIINLEAVGDLVPAGDIGATVAKISRRLSDPLTHEFVSCIESAGRYRWCRIAETFVSSVQSLRRWRPNR